MVNKEVQKFIKSSERIAGINKYKKIRYLQFETNFYGIDTATKEFLKQNLLRCIKQLGD